MLVGKHRKEFESPLDELAAVQRYRQATRDSVGWSNAESRMSARQQLSPTSADRRWGHSNE